MKTLDCYNLDELFKLRTEVEGRIVKMCSYGQVECYVDDYQENDLFSIAHMIGYPFKLTIMSSNGMNIIKEINVTGKPEFEMINILNTYYGLDEVGYFNFYRNKK